jgi:hypothetical protein
MNPEELQPLENQKAHLTEWLDRLKKARNVAPYVQNMLEITEWRIQALKSRPTEVSTPLPTELTSQFEHEHKYLTSMLPLIPSYLPDSVQNTFAVATSGASSMYAYVLKIGHQGTSISKDYSKKYTSLYMTLQASQERLNSVRRLVQKTFDSRLLEKFDRASQAFAAMKCGLAERTTVALEMRTLLDSIQGFLFEKSRKHPKENMTWNEMAKRLAKGVYAGHEHQTLLNQGYKRSNLINMLSPIAKDGEGKILHDLEDIWTQTLDHIFIVLGLVKL